MGIGPQQTDLVNSRMAYQRLHINLIGTQLIATSYALGAPMIAPGGKMRVVKCGVHLIGAGAVNSNFAIQFLKAIGDDSGRPVLAHGERVPLLTNAAAGYPIQASTADGYHISNDENSGAPLEPTNEFVLAPDEKPSRRRIKASQAGSSPTVSKLDASAVAIDKFYVGSFIKRMDTGEVREITDYVQASQSVTHAAWVALPTTMLVGTAFELTHDGLIFKPSDAAMITISSPGVGTMATPASIYMDLVELSKFSAAI